MRAPWISRLFFAFCLFFSFIATQPDYFPTVNLATTWTNDENSINSTSFTDGSKIRTIILKNCINLPQFTCGFFCNGTCTSYIFAILISLPYYPQHDEAITETPTVIWSANRDNPVSNGAILNLTASGGLVLQDVNGSIIWTTKTIGKSVAGMNLNDKGNLVLFDDHNSTVWQSFDHPTDCLVPGQKLLPGQELIASVLPTIGAAQKDSYSLQLTDKGLFAYVESNPPQAYFRLLANDSIGDPGIGDLVSAYVEFVSEQGAKLCLYVSSTDGSNICKSVGALPRMFTLQYVKLMPDGHLKMFGLDSSGETSVTDLLRDDRFGECSYPLACGRNAICSGNQHCSCPGTDYFGAVIVSQPNKGCFRVTPLTCYGTQDQHFIEMKNIRHLTYSADMEDVDIKTCKLACLNNCSCQAAIFTYYDSDSLSGSCDLSSELFTIILDALDPPNNASIFIKVQNVTSTTSSVSQSQSPVQPSSTGKRKPFWRGKKNQVATILASAIGIFVFLLIAVLCFTKFRFRKQTMDSEMEEEYLDQVPGMPTRFSYEELKTATENFSKKLGEGGFGSVFKGTLEDGSQIAVKCLQGLMHIKKSFLAEVESIGSIHHVNLVRLRGFCAWKSERLLVYEFMSNGSLDQWIYSGDRKHLLGWESRKKIILDIAKGLAYLHEDCSQKIIHLDIKPQNILLDEDFNAKISDFGLSKLIDRKQSHQVMTTMRGTPGYMAPEWLSSVITEKVDVYSFGIVLLEILCGRKNFDRSQPEESWHLLHVFQRSWEQGTLLHIVDRYSEDMKVHGTEVVEMMKVASWCLQTDFTRRPSMSSVMKVLEGVINVESNLDYNFTDPRLPETTNEHVKSSRPLLPSILSGPR